MASKEKRKAVLKHLREIADALPVVFYTVKETNPWKGEDLKLTGIEKAADGSEIEDGKIYLIDEPVQIAVNHERRLRKAYEKGGVVAVKGYVDGINKMIQEQRGSEVRVNAR